MKRTTHITGNRESDLFEPLRSLSSPFGVERIQLAVLGFSHRVSLWNVIRSFLAEFLALGVITATAANFIPILHADVATVANATAAPKDNRVARVDHIRPVSAAVQSATTVSSGSLLVTSTPPKVSPSAVEAQSIEYLSQTITRVQLIPAGTPRAETRSLNASSILPVYESPFLASESKTVFSSSVVGGALFGRMRMIAEGIDLNLARENYSLTFGYLRANGNRNLDEEILHHPSDLKLLVAEERQQFSLLAGIAIPMGPIQTHASIGPSYLVLKTTTATSATKVLDLPTLQYRFGAQCDIEIDYSLSSAIQAGIRGTAGYFGMPTGAVLLGLTVTP